jgi:hypothetical protein
MMMKNDSRALPAGFLALLLGVSSASLWAAEDVISEPVADQETTCAHHGTHMDEQHQQAKADMMAEFEANMAELNLSETQKQEFATLVELYRPRLQELAARGSDSRKEIVTIAPNDPDYNTKAAELSQLAGATAAEAIILLTELQSNAFALLSNDQQEVFLRLRAEQQAKMEQKKAELKAKMEEQRASGEQPAYGWPGMGGAN